MTDITCKIDSIKKGADGYIKVYLTYPGAMNRAELVFQFLPEKLGIEWFTTTSKRDMDKARGAP